MIKLKYKIFFNLVIILFFCLLSCEVYADSNLSLVDDEAPKIIINFDGTNLSQDKIVLPKKNSTILFVNNSRTKSVHLSIDFKNSRFHCHTKNLEFNSEGVMKTIKPIKYHEFEALCFPESGKYPLSVFDSSTGERISDGQIEVN